MNELWVLNFFDSMKAKRNPDLVKCTAVIKCLTINKVNILAGI